jgi:hypothetical protein
MKIGVLYAVSIWLSPVLIAVTFHEAAHHSSIDRQHVISDAIPSGIASLMHGSPNPATPTEVKLSPTHPRIVTSLHAVLPTQHFL